MPAEIFPFATLQDSKFYSVTRDDLASRQPLEGGYESTRPKFKGAARRTFRTGFTYVPDSVKLALESLWNKTYGGSIAFDWQNPSNLVTYSVKFTKPLEFRYTGVGNLRRWDVQLELREQ